MENFITPPFYPLDSVYHSHGVSIDDLAKSRFAPFCSTGEDFSSPPSEMNSNTSTPISGPRTKRPSRLTDFLRVRQLKHCKKKCSFPGNNVFRYLSKAFANAKIRPDDPMIFHFQLIVLSDIRLTFPFFISCIRLTPGGRRQKS